MAEATRRPPFLTRSRFTNSGRKLIYLIGGLIFALLAALILYPSLNLVLNSFLADGRLSLANYADFLTDTSTYVVLYNSLFVSLLGTLGATALGLFIAWLIARTDVPFKSFWRAIVIVPYLIPPFIGAIAWSYLLGPVGYINKLYMALSGNSDPLFVIYGKWGIILVMILYSYPIAYMISLGPLEKMNPTLEEAGRMSGAGILRVMRDISIPLVGPSIWGGALLIFMSLMANFGIPAVLGFPARFFVLTTKIYLTILNFDKANNLQVAAALSMTLVVVAVIAMQIQRKVQQGRSYAILSGKESQPQLVQLGKLKYAALGFLAIVFIVTVLAPLLAILLTSLTRATGVPLTWENLSLRHYEDLIFNVPKVRRALINSTLLAVLSATTIVFISMVISYLLIRIKIRGGQMIETLILLPYAIPGTIVALAMILAFLKPLPIINYSLYNTFWILYVAYLTRFLTFGVRSINAAFEQLHVSLEEAARISGADVVTTFKDIVVPLVRTNVFAGWFLAFMPAFTELTLSILLFSVNNETLGVVVFGLHQEGKVNLTAALALLIIIIVLILNIVTRRVTRGRLGF
ncbi:MAG: iron ABC transporter permease [Caldilineaceae bacterium]|nr:iron ABC transporter permease [Caldilineaceae bacterium]